MTPPWPVVISVSRIDGLALVVTYELDGPPISRYGELEWHDEDAEAGIRAGYTVTCPEAPDEVQQSLDWWAARLC